VLVLFVQGLLSEACTVVDVSPPVAGGTVGVVGGVGVTGVGGFVTTGLFDPRAYEFDIVKIFKRRNNIKNFLLFSEKVVLDPDVCNFIRRSLFN
jgi:hypothetical protein